MRVEKPCKMYGKFIADGYTNSEIALMLNVSRQAVSKYIQAHGLRDRIKINCKSNDPIDEVCERIEWHLSSAKKLRDLLKAVTDRIEITSLELASKNIRKLISEVEHGND